MLSQGKDNRTKSKANGNNPEILMNPMAEIKYSGDMIDGKFVKM